MFFKFIFLFMAIFSFGFSDQKLELNYNLKNTIRETINLIYDNPEQLTTRSSLYMVVSDKKDFELSYLVDSKDSKESEYTLIGLRYLDAKERQPLFLLKVNNRGDIFFLDSSFIRENILTKEEFLSKQDFLNKIFKEFKIELQKRVDLKNNNINSIKSNFLKQE